MPTKVRVIAVVVLIYALTLYMFGIFGDVIKNIGTTDPYRTFLQGKKIEIKLETDPFKAVAKVLTDGKLMTAWLLVTTALVVILGLVLAVYWRDIKSYLGMGLEKDPRGTYGTADWMTIGEAKKLLGMNKPGVILGRLGNTVVTLPQDFKGANKHIAVFGASGSGKSRTFARPNIVAVAKMGQSMVLTDPSGELFRDTGVWLEKQGYDVKVLNLVEFSHSDRWNPLDAIENEEDAQIFADVIIRNTETGVGKKGDPFWERAELNLLKALALYVKDYKPENQRNIGELYKLIANTDARGLDALFRNVPNDSAAKMAYNIYAQAIDQVKTGVIIGLGTRLQIFQNKIIREMTKVSDIDLYGPKLRKTAYFCIMPDQHSAYDFLASLFFSFLFIKLVKLADTTTDPQIRAREVYFILDEFPNIGEIPDFTKKISTIRKRNLHCAIIFQNIAQLENRYPHKQWIEIIGNCSTRLFLGCSDEETAKYISEALGTQSIHTRSVSRQGGIEGILDIERITQSVGKRPLLTPDEVERLPRDKSIVLITGHKPLMLDKLDYSLMKESDEFEIRDIKDYQREWYMEFLKREAEQTKTIQQATKSSSNNSATESRQSDSDDSMQAQKQQPPAEGTGNNEPVRYTQIEFDKTSDTCIAGAEDSTQEDTTNQGKKKKDLW